MQEIFSLFKNIRGTVVTAMVHARNVDIMLGEGFYKTFDEANIKQANALDELTSKDEIEAYVKEKTGVDIDKRGSLETVKEKAKAALNESGRADT